VHVLLGENGAGKSTLMKVLSGAIKSDSGEIELLGEPAQSHGPAHAQAPGLGILYQEFTPVPQLSAAENIFLGREPTLGLGVVDRRGLEQESARRLAGLGGRIGPPPPRAARSWTAAVSSRSWRAGWRSWEYGSTPLVPWPSWGSPSSRWSRWRRRST